MSFRVFGFAFMMVAFIAPTVGAADGKLDARAQKRLAEITAKYEKTGETRHCVPIRFLTDSTIIDDQTIFFKGLGKVAYMNRLPHRCSRLAQEGRFAYKVWIGQLCNTDIITVLDSFGREWSSCGLGDFEVMHKKPKAEQDGDADGDK